MIIFEDRGNTTEADLMYDCDDWAEAELEYNCLVDDEGRNNFIRRDRKRRERNLAGKFIVIVESRYNKNQILYLQDHMYGTGYWTRYRSNAIGYDNEADARRKAESLRFNNPRVMVVLASGKLKEVS